MKKVFFDKLDSRKNKALALPMIVFMVLYVYTAFGHRESPLHQISAILGFGFSVIFLGKQFFFRNYIGWNKKGMIIKAHPILSQSISFNDVSSYTLVDKKLEIERKDGSAFHCNLENLGSDDRVQIETILKANTRGHNGYTPPS